MLFFYRPLCWWCDAEKVGMRARGTEKNEIVVIAVAVISPKGFLCEVETPFVVLTKVILSTPYRSSGSSAL